MRDRIVDHVCRDAPAEQAASARALIKKRGNIAVQLTELGFAPGVVLEACCAESGIPPAPLGWLREPKPPSIDGIDAELCRRLGCAPVASTAGRVCIAYDDPEIAAGHDTLGLPPHQPYLALRPQLERAMKLLPEAEADPFAESTRAMTTAEMAGAVGGEARTISSPSEAEAALREAAKLLADDPSSLGTDLGLLPTLSSAEQPAPPPVADIDDADDDDAPLFDGPIDDIDAQELPAVSDLDDATQAVPYSMMSALAGKAEADIGMDDPTRAVVIIGGVNPMELEAPTVATPAPTFPPSKRDDDDDIDTAKVKPKDLANEVSTAKVKPKQLAAGREAKAAEAAAASIVVEPTIDADDVFAADDPPAPPPPAKAKPKKKAKAPPREEPPEEPAPPPVEEAADLDAPIAMPLEDLLIPTGPQATLDVDSLATDETRKRPKAEGPRGAIPVGAMSAPFADIPVAPMGTGAPTPTTAEVAPWAQFAKPRAAAPSPGPAPDIDEAAPGIRPAARVDRGASKASFAAPAEAPQRLPGQPVVGASAAPATPLEAIEDLPGGMTSRRRAGLQVTSLRETSMPAARPMITESLDPAMPAPETSKPAKRPVPDASGSTKRPAAQSKRAALAGDDKTGDIVAEAKKHKWLLAAGVAAVVILVVVASLHSSSDDAPPPPVPNANGDLNGRQAALIEQGKAEKDDRAASRLFTQAVALNPNATGARDAFLERARRSIHMHELVQAEQDLLLLRRRADAEQIEPQITELLKDLAEEKKKPAPPKPAPVPAPGKAP